jgi:hypothetical protein
MGWMTDIDEILRRNLTEDQLAGQRSRPRSA